MKRVLVMGAGKIGSLIALLLSETKDYEVHLADVALTGVDAQKVLQAAPRISSLCLDVQDEKAVIDYIGKHQIQAVISSLPYFLNLHLIHIAKATQIPYFDLTEDTQVKAYVHKIAAAAHSIFVPQCGLAPGFIGLAAHSLMQEFDTCKNAKLRVGALPERANNSLRYALTWSTDGLINEYGNPCPAIEKGSLVYKNALDDLESIEFDGTLYEAFNTSGGIGGLAELYKGKVENINYKTIRYPGHAEKMRFLMNELKLNEDRATLKRILEAALPKTYQDVVLIYISVEGIKNGEYLEKSFSKKIYPRLIQNIEWSAIQISTASALCVIVDLVLKSKKEYKGLILQEQFALPAFLSNRFGQYYR